MDKLMKPEKKLIDSGAEEVLKMEPTIPKKLNLQPDKIIVGAPKVRLTRKIKTEPKKPDTDPTQVFNMPSKTDDYKKRLTAANKEMESVLKRNAQKEEEKQKEEYKKAVERRRQQLLSTTPQTSLQTAPTKLTPNKQTDYEKQLLETRQKARKLFEESLQKNKPTTQLQTGDYKSGINQNEVDASLNSTAQSIAKYRKKVDATRTVQASIRRLNQPKMKDIKRQNLLAEASIPKNNYAALKTMAQLVSAEELKKMELEKDKAMKDEAARKVQASIRRLKQPKIKDIKKLKK